MNAKIEKLVSEASTLSHDDRILLGNMILGQDELLTPEWRDEIERRVAEENEGKVEFRPFSEMMLKMRRKYGSTSQD